jgi:hypothetical protein
MMLFFAAADEAIGFIGWIFESEAVGIVIF